VEFTAARDMMSVMMSRCALSLRLVARRRISSDKKRLRLIDSSGLRGMNHVVLAILNEAQLSITKHVNRLRVKGLTSLGHPLLCVRACVRVHTRACCCRFLEKRRNRTWNKVPRYASRQRYAQTRTRVKGRFVAGDKDIPGPQQPQNTVVRCPAVTACKPLLDSAEAAATALLLCRSRAAGVAADDDDTDTDAGAAAAGCCCWLLLLLLAVVCCCCCC
jgi:hypothetical protein